jgi:hypothetical protein
MLRAKRLAAVFVVSMLMTALLPADVVAGSGGGAASGDSVAPAVQADVEPAQPATTDAQPLADDVDPHAALAQALSVPDPVAHLPGGHATADRYGDLPVTVRGLSADAVFESVTGAASTDQSTVPPQVNPADATVTPAANGTFTGHLVDMDGNPVAGIEVLFCPSYQPGCDDGTRVSTNASGNFSASLPSAAYFLYFTDSIHRVADGCLWYASGWVWSDRQSCATTPPTDLGTVHMKTAVHISGTVRNADGDPIDGIKVGITGYLDVDTAGDGTYTLWVKGGQYYLHFKDPNKAYVDGYYGEGGVLVASSSEKNIQAATDIENLDLTMPTYYRVRGTVLDTISGGVPGATVTATGTTADTQAFATQFTSTSSSDGSFDVGVYPAGPYNLTITDDNAPHASAYYNGSTFVSSASAAAPLDVPGDLSGLEAALDREPAILGAVTDNLGAPVAAATVHAMAQDRSGDYLATTKSDGTYAVEVPGNATYTIRVLPDTSKWHETTLATPVSVGSGWAEPVDVVLVAYSHITGFLTNHDGQPVPNISVTVTGAVPSTSQADGSYNLTVDPGTYQLRLIDPARTYVDGWLGASGWVPDQSSAASVVVGQDATVTRNVVLPKYLHITGHISSPYPPTSVQATDGSLTVSGSIDGPTNNYDIKVAPGTYRIDTYVADLDEHWWYGSSGAVRVSTVATPVVMTWQDVSGIDISVSADRVISGFYQTEGGSPMDGQLFLYDLYDRQIVQTDTSAGSFTFYVRPGRYILGTQSESSGYPGVWYGPGGYVVSSADATVLDVTSSNVTGIHVVSPTGTEVWGTVFAAGGGALDTVVVEAWLDGVYWDMSITDSVSNYVFYMPPGQLQLWFYDLTGAHAPGWYAGPNTLVADWAASKTVTVGRSTVNLPVHMPSPRHITGWVMCGWAYRGSVEVDAVVNGAVTSFALSSTWGAFDIPVLPATYSLYAPGYGCSIVGWYGSGGFTLDMSTATAVPVSGSDVGGINFAIPPETQIWGRVTNVDGEPIDAYVEFFHNGEFYGGLVASGNYSAWVPSAQYTLAFVDLAGFYGSGWYSSHGLVRSSSQASLVSTLSGNPGNIDVVLPYLVPPGKPTGVAAGGFHNGAVVTWSAPADDGGTDITKYTVTSSPAGKTCTSISETRCIVYGLTNGTSYTFTVKATNAVGTGAASDPSGAVVPSPVPGPPGTPSAIAGNAAASVSWTPPAVPGGSAVSAYTVTSSPGGKTCTTTGALSCKVSGLTNGTAYTFTVTATNATGTGPASAPSAPVKPMQPASYHPIAPVRLVDTRISGTALTGKIAANSPRSFKVAGAAGIPANAVAITANLTVTNPTYAWAMYLGPDPSSSPSTSTINFVAGQTLANGVTVALTSSGYLYATYMSAAGNTTDMVLDVSGYFTADQTGDTYHPIAPVRDLDSRYGTGLSGKFTANTPRGLKVGGINGVPSGAKAVTGNITVTGSSFGWALYAGPAPVASPKASTLNFLTGQVASNNLTVALAADGQIYITFLSIAGAKTDVVFDVTGYYTADQTGYSFMPITPVRLLDTRVGNGLSGKLPVNTGKHFQVTGRNVIPPASEGVAAITGNATIVNETAGWAIYVGPADLDKPTTSALNFVAGDIKANGITVSLGPSGTLSITYIGAGSNTTDLVVDVTGYFVR